ncbi:hypothetical protein FAM09_24625 [Niastella caeni]|uniref:Uncharacterized protein n=1 Tax=Niastella caeni TaxID=2569763 RepID=A0A4S8HGP8_9BACT|nr:hypothetical protein [Niastella caeni]THU34207.1 hypothetical protein FAM09_24625 [Niastella caeni]
MEKYNTEMLKAEIINMPKHEKILAINQALNNYFLTQQGLGLQNSMDYEDDFEIKAKRLIEDIHVDTMFKYERDWNWYFNADNIPNQKSVFATKDFLEKYRSKDLEPLDFFNILFRQIDELKGHLDKPIDFINHLRALPISEIQKHTLWGMILYWHGGYPVENLNPKYDTILKLIERDFHSSLANAKTPEKDFCATSSEQIKVLKDAEANVHAALKRQFQITESRYLNKVDIDFEDLPKYVVQHGIVRMFEGEHFRKDADYMEWQNKLITFLNTISDQYVLKSLQKGVEYAQKVYYYHLQNECRDRNNCALNETWERRIALAEQLIEKLVPKVAVEDMNREETGGKNKDFTTARQVLALHYLLKQLGINIVDNPSSIAKFIQFLTGREVNANRIQDTTIYKKVVKPFNLNDKTLKRDLEFIIPFFKEIGLMAAVKDIEDEIAKC